MTVCLENLKKINGKIILITKQLSRYKIKMQSSVFFTLTNKQLEDKTKVPIMVIIQQKIHKNKLKKNCLKPTQENQRTSQEDSMEDKCVFDIIKMTTSLKVNF